MTCGSMLRIAEVGPGGQWGGRTTQDEPVAVRTDLRSAETTVPTGGLAAYGRQ
ncbi:hypothetical protein [Frankia sp. R82]|uniref:hypothetical protein n=1 Tax=Frankia sp. R82 TaxID=2950553 RepID=UPI00204327EF|nr:hypothetical protein [Frankia sp. R82]MCM3883937.1 hypothetical protein [Frankia sp. R82]